MRDLSIWVLWRRRRGEEAKLSYFFLAQARGGVDATVADEAAVRAAVGLAATRETEGR